MNASHLNNGHKKSGNLSLTALALGSLISAISVTDALADGSVNIYSYRQPGLIKPLLDEFTKDTGITTKIIFAKKGLAERIAAEGMNSPADILLSVALVNWLAPVKKVLLRPLKAIQ